MTETINEYKRLQAMGLDQNELNEWTDGEVQRFRAMGLADEEITNEFGFKVAPRNQQQEYWNEISEDFKKRENPEKLKDLASSENKFEFSKYFWEKGMKSGTIATGYAMAKGKELPSGLQEDFNDPSIIEQYSQALGTIISDIPVYIGGSAATNLLTWGRAGKVGSAFGAGYTNGALRGMFIEAIQRGDVKSWKEWWEIFVEEGNKSGLKEGAVIAAGVASPGLLSKVAPKIGSKYLAQYAATYTGFMGAGAVIEGEMPTAEEALVSALVLKTLMGGAKAAEKGIEYIKKSPEKSIPEAIEDIATDRLLKEDLLSKNNVDRHTPILKTQERLQELEAMQERVGKVEMPFEAVQELKKLQELNVNGEIKGSKDAELNLTTIKTIPIEQLLNESLYNRNQVRSIVNDPIFNKDKLIQEKIKPVVEQKDIDLVKSRISFEQYKPPKIKFKDFKNNIIKEYIDRYHPILLAMRRVDQGQFKPNEITPYKRFRLTQGNLGKANHWFEYGQLKFDDLSIIGRPIMEIIKPLKTVESYKDVNALLTARSNKERVDRGFETGIDKNATKTVIKKLGPKYNKIANELIEVGYNALKYMLDAGILDKKSFDLMTQANKDHVPFYRVMNDAGTKNNTFSKSVVNPIKEMKGSGKMIQDPIMNIYNNVQHYVALAENNFAKIKFIEFVENNKADFPEIFKIKPKKQNLEISKKELEQVLPEGIKLDSNTVNNLEIFRMDKKAITDSQIAFNKKGKLQIYEVGKDLAEAIKDIPHTEMSQAIRFFSIPAKLTRAGSVLAPSFMVSNFARDTIFSGVFSRSGAMPFVTPFIGLFNMINSTKYFGIGKQMQKVTKIDPLFEKFVKSGAMQSQLTSIDRIYYNSKMNKELMSVPIYNKINSPLELIKLTAEVGKSLEILRKGSDLFENTTRMGEFRLAYNKARKEGVGPREALERAGFEARDVTIDFMKMGSKMQALNRLVPFYNAGIQGSQKVLDAFFSPEVTRKQKITTQTKLFSFIVLPSMLLWWSNNNDKRYKKLPKWEKENYWIFYTQPGDDATPWKMPKPHGPGQLFGTGIEKTLDWIKGEDEMKLNDWFYDMFMQNVFDVYVPIPGFLTPVIEQWANKSLFTGQPLVSQSKMDILPAYQTSQSTSETAKWISKGLTSILGNNKDITSPIRLDNYIRMTSTLGQYAVTGLDKLLIEGGIVDDPIKPTDRLQDRLFFKSFVARTNSPNSQYIQDFYEKYEPIRKAKNTLQYLKNRGDLESFVELRTSLSKDLGFDIENAALSAHSDRMNTLRKLVEGFHNSKQMSPDEKRENIDLLLFNMIITSKNALDVINNVKKSKNEPLIININPTKEEYNLTN